MRPRAMSSPRIPDVPCPDATSEAVSIALTLIYRRAIERYQEATQVKEAARPGGPDDAKKESAKHVRARAIIPD
jgi:hypothetical protein